MVSRGIVSDLSTFPAVRRAGLESLCAASRSVFAYYYFYYPRAIRGGGALHGEA